MTVADDVMQALRERPEGMTDAELAALLGKRHQHINQTCRMLADQGLIIRDNAYGGIVNKVSGEAPERPTREPPPSATSTAEEWTWEGNVQSRIVTHLAKTGWNIIAVANTAQRERGVDIIAERDGQRMLVEVKGWPSAMYARGERAGQPKPTQPTLQASHWFAELLTSLIRRGAEHGSRLAMGLPDMPRYRTLLGEAAWALERLDITVYLVTAEGAVLVWAREN
jgi:Holliday junction resolvase-like predicted endonuclease